MQLPEARGTVSTELNFEGEPYGDFLVTVDPRRRIHVHTGGEMYQSVDFTGIGMDFCDTLIAELISLRARLQVIEKDTKKDTEKDINA
jgi:hypothetical protein